MISSIEPPPLTADPVLIVVDTRARWMEGNESDTQAAGDLVRALDTIKERYQCHILSVHHSGKGKERGGRGASAFRAADDVECLVDSKKSNDGLRITLTTTKQREGKKTPRWSWNLRPVTLEVMNIQVYGCPFVSSFCGSIPFNNEDERTKLSTMCVTACPMNLRQTLLIFWRLS